MLPPVLKVDIDHPTAEAKAKARTSVEIHDSCNCFKFCFPCIDKSGKTDASDVSRITDISRNSMREPEPTESEKSRVFKAHLIHPEFNDRVN